MNEEPRATCEGMVPGVCISEEERRRRDLSSRPERVRKAKPEIDADVDGDERE